MIHNTITESEMTFGKFNEKDVFEIEKSNVYKKLINKGIKSCEFILKRKDALLFIEAKKSCPNYNNYQETDEKTKKYHEFIDSIAEKFKHSLNIFSNVMLKRYEEKSVPEEFFENDFAKIKIQFIVVVKNAELEWLSHYKDKIEQILRKDMIIWKIRDIVFINEEIARKKNLIL